MHWDNADNIDVNIVVGSLSKQEHIDIKRHIPLSDNTTVHAFDKYYNSFVRLTCKAFKVWSALWQFMYGRTDQTVLSWQMYRRANQSLLASRPDMTRCRFTILLWSDHPLVSSFLLKCYRSSSVTVVSFAAHHLQ